MYYSAILGETTQVPEPITREEQYLCAIAEQGGGGGGGGGYTLPVASQETLGGVRGPAKTADETEPVHIDEQGNMWVKPGGGGGGIPVGNCTAIQSIPGDGRALIKWSDPADVVIEEITIAKWTGTRLVRKEGSYPADQSDGVIVTDSIVRDQYKDAWFIDSGLENGTTYYYKLFPHAGTTYTNNEANQLTVTPEAIPLGEVTEVSAKAGNSKVTLVWTDPADISESLGKDGATWVGTKVVRKIGGAPESPDDGTEVVNEKTRNQYQTDGFVDSGLDNGTEYFYGIYPYTTAGTYSSGYTTSATPYLEAPSPCTNLIVSGGNTMATISWADPPATEEKGNQIVTWAGTKLVRKEGSAPEAWEDGDLLVTSTERNQYQTEGYQDTELTNGTEYFYAVFAYSTDGVYSTGVSASVTPSEKRVMADYTWRELAELSDKIAAGEPYEGVLDLHDTKDVTLSGTYNEIVTMEIGGFNHDDKVGGGKAGITVIMKNLMAETAPMNGSSTNEGGFKASAMFTETLVNIYNSMPEDLKPYIRPVIKPTGLGGDSTEGTEDVECKLFLLSEQEVRGEKVNSVGGEGELYPIFTDQNSRIKKLSNGTGAANYYWLRSPHSGSSTLFCAIGSSGGVNGYGAGNSGGICFGFSLGLPSSVNPTLADNSWPDIESAGESGVAKETWQKGDTIDIELTGEYNETLTLEIADFDHDDLVSGGKAPITFICKNLMIETAQMNTIDTNSGGYSATKMHTEILPAILECFPEDLKKLIKTVKKPTGLGGGSSEGTEDVECKLWLMSEQEVRGEKISSVGEEGELYPIFTDANSRIKKLSNGTGEASHYWLRSPVSGSSAAFCRTSISGAATYNPARGSGGVAFGFCI